MDVNHYIILGMNGTGLDNNGSPYVLTDINRAYRQQAIKYHPDKTSHPDAAQHFENLLRSYELLTDLEKREEFDRLLNSNPGLFATQENLIIEVDDEDPGLDDLLLDENSEAIIVRLTKGINLTQLMQNAHYNTESILLLARRKPEFSKAVSGNSSLLAMLSIEQNFELIFIIYFHYKNQQFHFGSVENKNETFLLDSLVPGSSNYEEYSRAFVSVCLREKELATLFFEAHADILEKLERQNLLVLSQRFYEAVYPLIRWYGTNLSLKDLQFILQNHPEHKEDIIACMEASGLGSTLSKLDLGTLLVDMLSRKMPFNPELVNKAIDSLGMEALHLVMNMDYPEEDMFLYRFLQVFSEKEDSILALKNLNDYNRYVIIEAFLNLTCFYVNKPAKMQSSISLLLNNSEFIFELLSFLDAHSFVWLADILPKFTDKNLRRRYNEILLACKESGSESAQDSKPCLINLLMDTFPKKTLIDNPDLLISMLKKEEYVNELDVNPVFSKRAALWVAQSRLSLDEITTSLPLPSAFVSYYSAFTTFYQNYINLSTEVSSEVFHNLFNDTGYFPDITFIKTNDINIKFHLLISMSPFFDKIKQIPSTQQRQLKCWFIDVCRHGSKRQFDELLNLYQDKCPEFIVNMVNSTNRDSCVHALMFFNLLKENAYWNKRYITGALIDKWQLYLVNSHIFIETILESTEYGLEGVPEEKSPMIGFLASTLRLTSDIEKQKATISHILNEYKSTLQTDYPRCSLGGYLTLIESPVYQRKAEAYRRLIGSLGEISTGERPQINTNEVLLELVDYLLVCGVDLDTFSQICVRLNADIHRPLRSALIAMVMESPKTFWISEELRQYLSAHTVSDKEFSELAIQFQALAELYIHKQNKRIHGDMLQSLYAAHGEHIMPTLERYGLNIRLLNGKQIEKVMRSIEANESIVYKNAVIRTEETIAVLVGKLRNFIIKGLFNSVRTSINQEILAEFSAEVQTFVLNKNITHPTLSAILNVYHRLERDTPWQTVLMMWLIDLAVHVDEYFKPKAIELLNHEMTAALATNALADYWMRINQLTLSFSDMITLFGQNNADQVIHVYLRRISPVLTISDLEFGYIRDLLLTNKLSLVVLNHLTADNLSMVCKQGAYLVSALNTKTITIDHNIFSFTPDDIDLFPLFDNGLLSAEEIHVLTSNPVTKQLYTYVSQVSCTTNDVDAFNARASKMNAFCQNDFFNFLKSDILTPIKSEIDRLILTHGFQKALLMIRYKKEIETSICGIVSSGFEQGHEINSINRELHTQLQEKICSIIADPELNTFRYPIEAFFKELLGVLIAASCLFIPLAFAGYRNYFFNSTSVYNMKNMDASLESYDVRP